MVLPQPQLYSPFKVEIANIKNQAKMGGYECALRIWSPPKPVNRYNWIGVFCSPPGWLIYSHRLRKSVSSCECSVWSGKKYDGRVRGCWSGMYAGVGVGAWGRRRRALVWVRFYFILFIIININIIIILFIYLLFFFFGSMASSSLFILRSRGDF